MSNEPLPDGIAEGAEAYILAHHHTSGIGGYETAHLVRVERVTPTQVRVTGEITSGAPVTFRRDDLGRAVGKGRNWMLAAAASPRVQMATAAAKAVAAIAEMSQLGNVLLRLGHLGPAQMAGDFPARTDEALAAVTRIRNTALDVHERLLRLRAFAERHQLTVAE